MKKLINYFLAAVLLLNASCEDDNIFKQLVDPPAKVLPPATQIGANTFGCKVNGEVWLPSETAWMEFKDGGLDIISKYRFSPKQNIYLNIGKFTISHIGTYSISSITPYVSRGRYSIQKNEGGVFDAYVTDDINTGSITITRLDTSMRQYIISGTFSFKAKDVVTGEIVEVTDGRFDLKNY